MPTQLEPNMVATVAAAAAGTAVVGYAIYQKMKSPAFVEGGKVKRIFIYPIKSLAPVEVNSADFTADGLSYKELKDRFSLSFRSREFILVDADTKIVTGRQEPSIFLLNIEYRENSRSLRILSRNPEVNMEPLDITLEPQKGVDMSTVMRFRVIGSDCTKVERCLLLHSVLLPDAAYKAYACEERVSKWFSDYLNKKVVLTRLIKLDTGINKLVPNRFQDRSAVNILSEHSVDNPVDLINDPSANISYRNFRPSMLVETKQPFEEDFWSRMKIGDVETEFQLRCDRCMLTTIDPDSGIKTMKEPLVTLGKYRVDRSNEGKKYHLKPLSASHHVVRKLGKVSVGQTILVERAVKDLL